MSSANASLIHHQPSRTLLAFYRLEEVFAIFSVSFFGGFLGFTDDVTRLPVLPAGFVTLARYGIYAALILLLALRPKKTIGTMLCNGLVLALILMICLSFLWSPIPRAVLSVVVKEVVPMFLCSLYIASRFSVREQFRIFVSSLVLIFLTGVALAVAMPSVGTHVVGEFAGNWKGVFTQKNEFGAHATITLIALFLLANYAEVKQRWMFPFFGFCFVAVLVSGSVTALVLSVVGLGFAVLYRKFTWLGKRSVLWVSFLLLVVSTVGYILFSNWVDLISSLDRDPTLSNRTLIWSFLIEYKIPRNLSSFLIGHGRGVFWLTPNLFGGIEAAAKHTPAHAHSGYLDLILDVGMVGFSLLVIVWVNAYAEAVKLAYRFKQAAHLWPIVFLSMLVLFNIFESYLARATNFYWVTFIAIALTLNQRNLRLN